MKGDQNPFTVIDRRLSGIEELLSKALIHLERHASTAPEVGGLDLAQEVTGLSKNTLYALVSKRGIPHSKRGNKLYFNRAELLGWVAQGSREVAEKGEARG